MKDLLVIQDSRTGTARTAAETLPTWARGTSASNRARGKRAFLGPTVGGSELRVRNCLNRAYYGRALTPIQILVEDTASIPQASPLLGTLNTHPR